MVGSWILLIGGIVIYFLPSFVARGKSFSTQVFILNLFLGWTLIGWVGALVWAAGYDHHGEALKQAKQKQENENKDRYL